MTLFGRQQFCAISLFHPLKLQPSFIIHPPTLPSSTHWPTSPTHTPFKPPLHHLDHLPPPGAAEILACLWSRGEGLNVLLTELRFDSFLSFFLSGRAQTINNNKWQKLKSGRLGSGWMQHEVSWGVTLWLLGKNIKKKKIKGSKVWKNKYLSQRCSKKRQQFLHLVVITSTATRSRLDWKAT